MSSTTSPHYYTIESKDLASWLEGQLDVEWICDGEPALSQILNFPCTASELADELRKGDRRLRVYDLSEKSKAKGEPLKDNHLLDLATRDNNSKTTSFVLSWDDDTKPWILYAFKNAEDETE